MTKKEQFVNELNMVSKINERIDNEITELEQQLKSDHVPDVGKEMPGQSEQPEEKTAEEAVKLADQYVDAIKYENDPSFHSAFMDGYLAGASQQVNSILQECIEEIEKDETIYYYGSNLLEKVLEILKSKMK